MTPHASAVPTSASATSTTIFTAQRIATGRPSTPARRRGSVSDTRVVMPAAWTSALCSVIDTWLCPASANSAVRMPAALRLTAPTRNQWLDPRLRGRSAVATDRSYQEAPASGSRRPPATARMKPPTSSATPTPSVVQYRGTSSVWMIATDRPTSVRINPASITPFPERCRAMVWASSDSASNRIGQQQAVGRVGCRAVEASGESGGRVLEIVRIVTALKLEVHVLVPGPRALARRADRADALTARDVLAGGDRERGQVAVHRAIAVRVVHDHDDQPAGVAVVASHHDAAARRGDDIAADAGGDVDAAMWTQSRVAFATAPVTEARDRPRGPAAPADRHADQSGGRRHHEDERRDGIDEDGDEIETAMAPARPHEPNERAHERP